MSEWPKETQAQYAARQRARDLDAIEREKRAQKVRDDLSAGIPVANSFLPPSIFDGMVKRALVEGPFARMGRELLAKEDSERVTPTRAESDLDWELS